MSAGSDRIGGVVSVTETPKEPLARLPRVSSALQETSVPPGANVEPEAGEHDTLLAPSTRSVALAVNDRVVPLLEVASRLMGAGSVRTGGFVSMTRTSKLPVAVFPRVSDALHFTVVVPSAKVAPDCGVQETTRAPSTASCALTVNCTWAPFGPVASAVKSAGRVRTGALVSATMIWIVRVAVLPRESAALQETVVVPTGNVEPEAGEHVTGRVPSTVSVAVALNSTTAPSPPAASRVTLVESLSAGGVVSTTLTWKVPLAELERESDDVHVTVVVPNAKVVPDAGLQETGRDPSTRSLAVTVNETAAPPGPVASAVFGAGSASDGGVVSCTTIRNDPVAVLERESVALHVTVVVAIGNVEPEAPSQFTGTDPSTVSVAEAEKVAGAPDDAAASSVWSGGSERTGLVVSRTVMVKLVLAFGPPFSTEHVTVDVPSAKVEPDGGLQLAVRGSFPLFSTTVKVATAPAGPVASNV